MTAREKLAIDHPQLINETFWGGCVGCPDRHGYLTRPAFCKDKLYPSEANCANCWDREIPESKDCTTCSYADVPVDETPCKECDGSSKYQSKTIDKFNAIGNVQPIFPDEFKEGERKHMYSLFLKEFANAGVRYKLLEENKDLTTISEKVKRLVISGTPIDDLRIVKNVEFEFKCVLKFKEDE